MSGIAILEKDDTLGELSSEIGDTAKPVRMIPSVIGPDLSIGMTHSGDFTVGGQGVYTLTITNVGVAATTDTITVTDILPPGLAYISATGVAWSCVADRIITCMNATPHEPKSSSTITLTAGVESQAWPGVTNLATVSNGGDRNRSNDTVGDPAVVLP